MLTCTFGWLSLYVLNLFVTFTGSGVFRGIIICRRLRPVADSMPSTPRSCELTLVTDMLRVPVFMTMPA